MNKRTLTLAVAIPAAAVLLTACGSSGGDSSSGSMSGHDMSTMAASDSMMGGVHNAADITFVQEMIPHHEQALDMAMLAATRASDPQVKKLAEEIELAQSPEIEKMNGWLKGWGAPTASAMAGDTGTEGHSMAGMMSESDMKALEATKGAAFDKAFLTMMIEHHEGALTMARTVKSDGSSPEVAALADAIISGQTEQITTMNQLLTA